MKWTVADIASPNANAEGVWTVSNNAMAGTYSQSFTFTITITCVVNSISVTSEPLDATHNLDAAAFNTIALVLVQDSSCSLPYTYTHAFKKDGVTTTQPTWLSWDAQSLMWNVAQISSPNANAIGVWRAITTATAGGGSSTT